MCVGGGGGGGGGTVWDFPTCRFCFFSRIAIGLIYAPFVQILMYL